MTKYSVVGFVAHQVFAEAPAIVFPAVKAFLQGDWPAASDKVTTDPRKVSAYARNHH